MQPSPLGAAELQGQLRWVVHTVVWPGATAFGVGADVAHLYFNVLLALACQQDMQATKGLDRFFALDDCF